DVGDHHVPAYPDLLCGVHGPHRCFVIDRDGAGGVASPGPGREDHRTGAVERLSEGIDVGLLDIQQHWFCPGGCHIVAMVGVADEGLNPIPGGGEFGGGEQGDLAVPAHDHHALVLCHREPPAS